jgi:hypothetical protein
MDLDKMNREELIQHINELNHYMDNVIVLWGNKRELKETFRQVAKNEDGEFTDEEALNAATIIETDGAFDDFIELVRDSFDRGGINYVISEKISAIMEEVSRKYRMV